DDPVAPARASHRLDRGLGGAPRRRPPGAPLLACAEPLLAETYYDEALTGLMAFAILHGAPQVFYWGEPYGGAIGGAYPAAIGFWLFGASPLVLRMAAAIIAVLWAWSLWFIARRAGAKRFAILAGLLIAVPPIFLSHAQLSTHGESSALS